MDAQGQTAQDAGWRAGLVFGAGMGLGVFALATGFGAAAVAQGWPAWLATLMSAIVFAGGSQFALVMAYGGGGMPAALGAATLINLRFIPMVLTALADLRGGRWRRAVEAQAVLDASWAAARRPGGGVDRDKLIGATLAQWPAWVGGTAVGAYLAPPPALARAFGLDVIFPAFFLVFVIDIVRKEPRYRSTVALAVCITAPLCWLVPPGVALMAAGLAALPMLWRASSR